MVWMSVSLSLLVGNTERRNRAQVNNNLEITIHLYQLMQLREDGTINTAELRQLLNLDADCDE